MPVQDERTILGAPAQKGPMNPPAVSAFESTRPHRHMTAQHRQNLSRSIKNLWAARGGLSSETRQKISASAKERWAERVRLAGEHQLAK